ncbi:MAG: hypothetical protein IJU62_09210 [Muribaculaceae bacterium]|nr:hypothetical protein [Muribaculaceae bacterium]
MRFLEKIGAHIGATTVAVAVMAIAAAMLWIYPPALDEVHHGLFYTTRVSYICSPPLARALAIALGVAAALMLLLLNKVYTFIRAVTNLQATLLAALLAAWPAAVVCGTAMVLPLLFTLLVILVFESYEQPASQRRCLTAAAVISTGCLFDYAFAVLLPPIVIGMINAKAMNVKTAIATALGLIAPPWIVLATGLAHLSQFNVPHVEPVTLSVLDIGYSRIMVANTVARMSLIALCIVTLSLMIANVAATESNRLVLRVHNSVFHLTGVTVVVAMLVDVDSVPTLLPLLCLTAAHEVTQFTAHSRSPLRYLLPLLLLLAVPVLFIVCLVVTIDV